VIKIVYPCRRRSDLDRDEYARRILEGHVPLALKHHPGMLRYTVNIVEREPEGGPPADSVAELWFASLESYRDELYGSDEDRRIIGEDVARFLGHADAYATREAVHKGELAPAGGGSRTPGAKWMVFVRRKPELSREQFLAHWRDIHVPLVLREMPALRRYVTNAVERRLSETGPDWDGVSELWWESRDAARAALRAGGAAIEADSARFLAEAKTYTVAEHVQK
jgi:uncharacterized protein (TIGR02118 family)